MSWRGDSPRGREATETSAATAIPAILVLLAAGLALRLIIAYVIFPGSGFPNDLGAFQAWGNDIARNGPVGFYDRQSFIDYPPVYLLLLGVVSLLTGGSIGEGVKILPILADLALAGVVWVMVQELGGSGRRALITAAIVLFNPITWFNSAIWGQADAVGSILLLLGLRELQRDRREVASGLAVLAVLTKMQLGILGFVVGFVVLRRSLAPRTGGRDPARVLTSVGAGLVTGAAVCLPFTGLDFAGLAGRLSSAAGLLTIAVGLVTALGVFSPRGATCPRPTRPGERCVSALLGAGTAVVFAGMVFDSIASHLLNTFGEYPYLTLNAYNPWALVTTGTGEAMDRALSWIRDAPFTDPQHGRHRPRLRLRSVPGDVRDGRASDWPSCSPWGQSWRGRGRCHEIARQLAEMGQLQPLPVRRPSRPILATGPPSCAAWRVPAPWPPPSIAFVVGGQLIAPLSAIVVGDGS